MARQDGRAHGRDAGWIVNRRPVLVFPQPARLPRTPVPRFGTSTLHRPDARRQHERLDARFERLLRDLQTARLQPDASGGGAQRVLVITTAGSADSFVKAAKNLGTGKHLGKSLPGLQWLADWAGGESEPDEDFYYEHEDARIDKDIDQRLYLVGTNVQGLERLRRLWQGWDGLRTAQELKIPTALTELFEQIRELRWWDVQDRIAETGVLAFWRESLDLAPNSPKRCEVELWNRGILSASREPERRVRAIVEAMGGRIVERAWVSEIHYHALLLEVPATVVQRVVDGDESVELIRADDLQFIRPTGQALRWLHPDHQGSSRRPMSVVFPRDSQTTIKQPAVAMLDGVPIANHPALTDRITVDNFLDLNPPVHLRRHGTAVASLAIHGNLADPQPISRLLLNVPLLAPNNLPGEGECLPDDRLAVDLIREAVERCIPNASAHHNGHDIRIFLLTLGDMSQPMLRGPSPLARLLDWLAWKHKLLFIISAGNSNGLSHGDVRVEVDADTWREMTDEERRLHFISVIDRDARHHTLLAPAEALNALTIGALNADFDSRPADEGRIDPGYGHTIPALYSGIGPGVRGAQKPDLLLPGGRQWLQRPIQEGPPLVFEPAIGGGMLVAEPQRPGSNATWDCGTSFAAPLVAHAVDAILDVLEDLAPPNGSPLARHGHVAVLVKAMLTHGATRRPLDAIVRAAMRRSGATRITDALLGRLLGYGVPDFNRALRADERRAVVVQLQRIGANAAHDYFIPVPPELIQTAAKRRLTITLASLTPVKPDHAMYRGAQVSVQFNPTMIGMETVEASERSSQKGTLEHRVFEGHQVPPEFPETLPVRVQCRPVAGICTDDEVPYAIVVTLEALEEIDIDLHAFVAQGIAAQVRARSASRVPVRGR